MANRLLSREAERIVVLTRPFPRELYGHKVELSRVTGVERRSPRLSVAMILAHLADSNDRLTEVVPRLSDEEELPGALVTSELHGVADAGYEALGAFKESVARYLKQIAALPQLRSRARYVHPWFGPLNAHQWHCVAAGHHLIHRRQLEHLLNRLAVAVLRGEEPELTPAPP